MNFPACTYFLFIFCAIFSKNLALKNEAPQNATSYVHEEIKTESNLTIKENPETWPENSTELSGILATVESIKTDLNFTKLNVDNETLNDIKPFLFFPILPFLFPKDNEGNEIAKPRNESKVQNSTAEGKPFILFDFAFNIREIPLDNRTEVMDRPKTTPSKDKFPRKRRNVNPRKESPGIFDDFPLFPDSEVEEFLPKPDFFLPDSSIRSKPLKKLSRQKRDKVKPNFPGDLKLFLDAFDDAFMRSKRELEQTDPILNFLRGAERSLEDEKEDEFLEGFPSVADKGFRSGGRKNGKKGRSPESPMIIVDKVVKIGEFHVHDDGHNKGKQKKRSLKFLNGGNHGEGRAEKEIKSETARNLFQIIEQPHLHESRKRKRNHEVPLIEESRMLPKIESKEIKILTEEGPSVLTVGRNATIELKKKDGKNSPGRGDLEVQDRPKRYHEGLNRPKPHYDDLKRNITEVLTRFLAIVKKLDEAKLVEKHGDGRFDWTEKETLQNGGVLGMGVREKRQKGMDFADEYADVKIKDRQVVDMNYLFLTVTLPTMLVFALLLLICFFNLQVKGKICTKLFKPRQVFLVEDETPLKAVARIKKTQAI